MGHFFGLYPWRKDLFNKEFINFYVKRIFFRIAYSVDISLKRFCLFLFLPSRGENTPTTILSHSRLMFLVKNFFGSLFCGPEENNTKIPGFFPPKRPLSCEGGVKLPPPKPRNTPGLPRLSKPVLFWLRPEPNLRLGFIANHCPSFPLPCWEFLPFKGRVLSPIHDSWGANHPGFLWPRVLVFYLGSHLPRVGPGGWNRNTRYTSTATPLKGTGVQ